jgi:CRP-like cAMP-binding protein
MPRVTGEMSDTGGSVARTVHEIFLTSFLGDDELLDLEVLGPAFARLAESMTDEDFHAGATVYRAGEPAREFLFIASGEIVVKMPDGAVLTLGERNVAGGTEVTAGRAYTQSATATTRTHVVRLPRDALFDVVEDYFLVAQIMLKNASKGAQEIRRALAGASRYPEMRALDMARSDTSKLNLVDRILSLRACTVFKVAPMQAITKLAELSSERSLEADEPVPNESSAPTTVHVVMAGALEAKHREIPSLAARFTPGEVVFLDAVLAGTMTEYDVRAIVSSVVLTFDLDDLFDVMEEHVEVIRSVLIGMGTEYEQLLGHSLAGGGEPIGGSWFKKFQRP